MATRERLYVDTAILRYRSGYREVNALLAVPSLPQPLPTILLAHDIYGLDQHIEDVVVRLAREGYVVLAPDFYTTKGGAPHLAPKAGRRDLVRDTPDPLALSDITSGINYIKGESYVDRSRIGILGFGFGGTIALLAASQNPTFGAVVDFYGDLVYPSYTISRAKPNSPIDMIGYIRCPILGIYGTADDEISRSDVSLLERRLREKGKGFELKVYPNAKNGFFNDSRSDVYQPAAAREAWTVALNWLKKAL